MNWEEIFTLIKDFGYPAVVAFAVGWYLVQKDKTHLSERKESDQKWRDLADKQQDELLEVIGNNNKVLGKFSESNAKSISELSSVVGGLNATVTGFLQRPPN